jgi:hypothetical protein
MGQFSVEKPVAPGSVLSGNQQPHRLAMSIDTVNLEDIFRQVQANANDLHDISPSMQLPDDGNPRREGGVHTIGAR